MAITYPQAARIYAKRAGKPFKMYKRNEPEYAEVRKIMTESKTTDLGDTIKRTAMVVPDGKRVKLKMQCDCGSNEKAAEKKAKAKQRREMKKKGIAPPPKPKTAPAKPKPAPVKTAPAKKNIQKSILEMFKKKP
tara:strand:+ start:70 stop:471 length:402 start_codon:yes stop_codon:yes gene_type:complete